MRISNADSLMTTNKFSGQFLENKNEKLTVKLLIYYFLDL